jgi:hypothetical protein
MRNKAVVDEQQIPRLNRKSGLLKITAFLAKLTNKKPAT